MTDTTSAPAADYRCHVLPGDGFAVISGANTGDSLLGVEALSSGDVYRLDPATRPHQIAVSDAAGTAGQLLAQATGGQHLAAGTELGTPGTPLRAAARLTFLAPEGHKVDLLLLELAIAGNRTFAALPLDPFEPGCGHTLIGIHTPPGPVRFSDITPLAFARGTHITLADGRQAPVETLRPGTPVLSRDNGPQTVRHVLHRTLRSVGPFAPVVIPKETLGNAGDLVVSQQQRLFVYRRGTDPLTETAEMMVKAGYLVDGERIFLRPGGYADFYSLVFDRHEVIYAECIPVESLQVNAATLATLPEDISGELRDLDHRPHSGRDASRKTARATRDRLLKERAPRW